MLGDTLGLRCGDGEPSLPFFTPSTTREGRSAKVTTVETLFYFACKITETDPTTNVVKSCETPHCLLEKLLVEGVPYHRLSMAYPVSKPKAGWPIYQAGVYKGHTATNNTIVIKGRGNYFSQNDTLNLTVVRKDLATYLVDFKIYDSLGILRYDGGTGLNKVIESVSFTGTLVKDWIAPEVGV